MDVIRHDLRPVLFTFYPYCLVLKALHTVTHLLFASHSNWHFCRRMLHALRFRPVLATILPSRNVCCEVIDQLTNVPSVYTWYPKHLSQWPRRLRRGFVAASLLGLQVRIPLEAWTFVYRECCVLWRTGLSVWLITRPEESYRVRCVWVWSWSFDNDEAPAH
jgi:hypothetical protein